MNEKDTGDQSTVRNSEEVSKQNMTKKKRNNRTMWIWKRMTLKVLKKQLYPILHDGGGRGGRMIEG